MSGLGAGRGGVLQEALNKLFDSLWTQDKQLISFVVSPSI